MELGIHIMEFLKVAVEQCLLAQRKEAMQQVVANK
jgi:hypothetical protein